MSKRDVDRYFPRNGPCMFHPTRYARHRLLDAIRMMHERGDSVAKIMRYYKLSRAAVYAAIHSSPNDNRMTPKEIREGRNSWRRIVKEGDYGK